jgi:acyl carrier protein|tara:strand:+ start:101 stop:322 length:222 start_codon:yes stop_codon:yes gene_type:complete
MLVEKKIIKILKSINKNIKFDLNLSDQLDSMQFLNCIVDIEKTFKIKIKEKEIKISNFKNINSIKKLINEKKK